MYQNKTMDRGKSNPKVDSADNGDCKSATREAAISTTPSNYPSCDTCVDLDVLDLLPEVSYITDITYDEDQLEAVLEETAQLPSLFGKARPTGAVQSPWLDNCPRIITVEFLKEHTYDEKFLRLIFRAASSEAGRKHVWMGPFAGGRDYLLRLTREFREEFSRIPRNVIPRVKGFTPYPNCLLGLASLVDGSCEFEYSRDPNHWVIFHDPINFGFLAAPGKNTGLFDDIRASGASVFLDYDLDNFAPPTWLREVPDWIRSGELIDRDS